MSPRFVRTFLRLLAAVVPLALGSGCLTVSVYQPLTGLQRPVVVDPALENFTGTKLLIKCAASKDFSNWDAEILCRKASTLFRNQGAAVDTEILRENASSSSKADEEAGKPDLVLVLKSRLVHEEDSTLLKVLCVISFTLTPSVNERTYAEEISVFDRSGSLLAADTLQSRFIVYTGVGIWGVNGILDVLVRPDDQELTGDVAARDFSRDLYGQISQLVFNAKIRQRVLTGFPAPVTEPGPIGAH